MINKIKGLFKPKRGETDLKSNGSIEITDKKVIELYASNPDNTFLISFPRTGSHWLRMLMELYFGVPSLVRVFYYHEKLNFMTLHTHDLDLDIERKNVIYLYREPIATIYSQLQYYREDIHDVERISYWTELYGKHLDKWLYQETFTLKKTIIRYEYLKANLFDEFNKICMHFNLKLNEKHLESIAGDVSKETVKNKTAHDRQVINLKMSYHAEREKFYESYKELIWNILFGKREHLGRYFE